MLHDAAVIYQRNLDAVTKAVWALDLKQLLTHVALPMQMLTADTEIIVTSADEMLLLAVDFRDAMLRMGADSYRRICRSARFLSPAGHVIQGQHDTYVLRDGKALQPPYLNDMTLIRSADSAWRTVRVEAQTCNSEQCFISPDLALGQRQALQRLFGGNVTLRGKVEE